MKHRRYFLNLLFIFTVFLSFFPKTVSEGSISVAVQVGTTLIDKAIVAVAAAGAIVASKIWEKERKYVLHDKDESKVNVELKETSLTDCGQCICYGKATLDSDKEIKTAELVKIIGEAVSSDFKKDEECNVSVFAKKITEVKQSAEFAISIDQWQKASRAVKLDYSANHHIETNSRLLERFKQNSQEIVIWESSNKNAHLKISVGNSKISQWRYSQRQLARQRQMKMYQESIQYMKDHSWEFPDELLEKLGISHRQLALKPYEDLNDYERACAPYEPKYANTFAAHLVFRSQKDIIKNFCKQEKVKKRIKLFTPDFSTDQNEARTLRLLSNSIKFNHHKIYKKCVRELDKKFKDSYVEERIKRRKAYICSIRPGFAACVIGSDFHKQSYMENVIEERLFELRIKQSRKKRCESILEKAETILKKCLSKQAHENLAKKPPQNNKNNDRDIEALLITVTALSADAREKGFNEEAQLLNEFIKMAHLVKEFGVGATIEFAKGRLLVGAYSAILSKLALLHPAAAATFAIGSLAAGGYYALKGAYELTSSKNGFSREVSDWLSSLSPNQAGKIVGETGALFLYPALKNKLSILKKWALFEEQIKNTCKKACSRITNALKSGLLKSEATQGNNYLNGLSDGFMTLFDAAKSEAVASTGNKTQVFKRAAKFAQKNPELTQFYTNPTEATLNTLNIQLKLVNQKICSFNDKAMLNCGTRLSLEMGGIASVGEVGNLICYARNVLPVKTPQAFVLQEAVLTARGNPDAVKAWGTFDKAIKGVLQAQGEAIAEGVVSYNDKETFQLYSRLTCDMVPREEVFIAHREASNIKISNISKNPEKILKLCAKKLGQKINSCFDDLPKSKADKLGRAWVGKNCKNVTNTKTAEILGFEREFQTKEGYFLKAYRKAMLKKYNNKKIANFELKQMLYRDTLEPVSFDSINCVEFKSKQHVWATLRNNHSTNIE